METATLVAIFTSGLLVVLLGTPYIPLLGILLNNLKIHFEEHGD